MSITELQLLIERRQRYIIAEVSVLNGQSYSIDNRSLTRADLAEIRKAITDFTNQILAISGGSLKQQRVIPR